MAKLEATGATSKPTESFIDRVLSFLKGGDEEKLKRFQRKANKYAESQIEAFTRKIEDLDDTMTDVQDRLNETIVNIDMDRIQSTDETKGYISDYFDRVSKIENEIEKVQAAKEECLEQIKKYEKIRSYLK